MPLPILVSVTLRSTTKGSQFASFWGNLTLKKIGIFLEFDSIWEYTSGERSKEMHFCIGGKENEKILSFRKKTWQGLKLEEVLQDFPVILKKGTIRGF